MTVIQIFNVQSVSLVSISDAQFKKKKTKTAQVMRIVRTVLDVLALGNVLRISHFIGDYSEKSLLCETMENDELGYCAESSLKQDSQICLDDQNFCDYEKNNGHDVYTMNRECECSRGHTDKKFCPLASKSEEMKIFRDMFKEIVWKNRKAHTSYRFKMSYDEERTMLYYNSYPLYLDADECSIEIDMDNHKDKKNLFYFLE